MALLLHIGRLQRLLPSRRYIHVTDVGWPHGLCSSLSWMCLVAASLPFSSQAKRLAFDEMLYAEIWSLWRVCGGHLCRRLCTDAASKDGYCLSQQPHSHTIASVCGCRGMESLDDKDCILNHFFLIFWEHPLLSTFLPFFPFKSKSFPFFISTFIFHHFTCSRTSGCDDLTFLMGYFSV